MKKTGICLLLSALLAFSVTPGCALGASGRRGAEDIASRPESGLSLPAEEGTEDVNHPAAGWHQEEGKWYLLSDGERLTGWQTVDGKRYYLDETGVMLDGWQQIDGSWYLFAGGAMQTGWKLSGGNWYYFSDTGVMQTGWLDQGGRRYYLTASGAMKRGLITEGETVYTLGDSGAVSGNKPLSSLPNQSYGWGQGVQVDGLNRPVGSTSYQDRFGQYDAYFIGPNTKTIYLTFDEGYENGYTASILDTLKEKRGCRNLLHHRRLPGKGTGTGPPDGRRGPYRRKHPHGQPPEPRQQLDCHPQRRAAGPPQPDAGAV